MGALSFLFVARNIALLRHADGTSHNFVPCQGWGTSDGSYRYIKDDRAINQVKTLYSFRLSFIGTFNYWNIRLIRVISYNQSQYRRRLGGRELTVYTLLQEAEGVETLLTARRCCRSDLWNADPSGNVFNATSRSTYWITGSVSGIKIFQSEGGASSSSTDTEIGRASCRERV